MHLEWAHMSPPIGSQKLSFCPSFLYQIRALQALEVEEDSRRLEEDGPDHQPNRILDRGMKVPDEWIDRSEREFCK